MFDYLVFSDEIKGFSRPEYLVILISFVYGFSLSDLFYNFSLMVRKRTYYTETLIWTWLLIINVIIYWYILWRNILEIDNSLFIYLLNFIPPFFLFVIISLLYPTDTKKKYDPKTSFLENRKFIFSAFVVFVLSMMLNSVFLNHNFSTIFLFRIIDVALLLLCVFIDKKIMRYATAFWLISWDIILIFIARI